jgi:hypothetical protein
MNVDKILETGTSFVKVLRARHDFRQETSS